MKNKLFLPIVLALALLAAGGSAVWWYLAPDENTFARSETVSKTPANYKYISMEKVIVMLRRDEGGPMRHYMSTDLVFKFEDEQEKMLKEQIPLLRSIAVKALSGYTFDKVSTSTIDQITADINLAFQQSYEQNPQDKPFLEVLISKLIVE